MAGLDCSKIKTGFTNQVCGKPAIAGTTARVILLSYSDVDKSKSVVTDNVISSLILKAGATGYEVDSLPNATVGSDTINAGTYLKTHQHNVVVRIFKKSEAAKKFVNGLTNARVIAIVENNDTGDNGDTKYEVYGWDSGLELTEITVTTEMTDGVAYQVTLANGTIAQEGSLPMSLFNTDEKTTDLMVDGLLAGGTERTVPAILRFYPAEGQAKIGNDVPLTLQRSSCTNISGKVTMPPAPTSTKPAEAFPGCGLPSNYVLLTADGQAAANPPVLQYIKGLAGTATTWGASIADTDIRKDYVNGEYVIILTTYAGVPK
jgi:hypothetical protein|nr:MAG TPA: hypothetical protein [Caudoviricetes sp.]